MPLDFSRDKAHVTNDPVCRTFLVEQDYGKAEVHVVRSLLPAHMRYYDIAGFVTQDLGDRWRVAVYGSLDATRAFIGVALFRNARHKEIAHGLPITTQA